VQSMRSREMQSLRLIVIEPISVGFFLPSRIYREFRGTHFTKNAFHYFSEYLVEILNGTAVA